MRKCDYFVKMLSDFNRGADLKEGKVYGLNYKPFVDNLLKRGYARWATKEEIESR
ncbi:hypothetical protein D3C73_278350 [compost metagenome]